MRRKDVSKFIIPEVYGDALSYEEQVLQMKSDVKELKENTNELSERVEGIGGDVEDVKADIDILQYNDHLQDTKIEAIENDYLSKQNGGTVHGGVLFDNLRAGDEDNGGDLLVSSDGTMTFIKHRDGNGNEGGMAIANIGEDDKPFLQISSDGGVQITDLDTPTTDDEAANKKYVDTGLNTKVSKTGDTVAGTLEFTTGSIKLDNGILYMGPTPSPSGTAGMIRNMKDPTVATDGATKGYVDNVVSAVETIANNKVAQISSANKLYATASDGSQTSLTYGTGSTQYAIVERTTGGNIILPTITSSSNDNYAATKKYVDDSVTASVAGVASIGGATGAITLGNALSMANNVLGVELNSVQVVVQSNFTDATMYYAYQCGKIVFFSGKYLDNGAPNSNTISVNGVTSFAGGHGVIFNSTGEICNVVADTTYFAMFEMNNGTVNDTNFFGIIVLS